MQTCCGNAEQAQKGENAVGTCQYGLLHRDNKGSGGGGAGVSESVCWRTPPSSSRLASRCARPRFLHLLAQARTGRRGGGKVVERKWRDAEGIADMNGGERVKDDGPERHKCEKN